MSNAPTNGEQLSAWLDGELTDLEAAEIERELDRNPLLRAELDELRDVRELLRTHGQAQAPDDFLAKVLARTENEPLPANDPTFWRWLRRPFGVPIEALAVAAAALLVVVAGLDLGVDALTPPSEAELAKSRAGDKEAAPEVAASSWDDVDAPIGDLPPPTTGGSADEAKKPSKKAATPSTRAPSPKSTATTQQAEPAEDLEGAADGGTAEAPETEAGPEIGTGTAGEPQPAVTGWRYQTTTDDPDILLMLQRLAGKFGGTVLDSRGRRVTGGAFDPSMAGSYLVQVPTDRLLAFDDAVRSLGLTQSVKPETRSFASEYVLVQVDITWMHVEQKQAAPAKKSAPTYETPSYEAPAEKK